MSKRKRSYSEVSSRSRGVEKSEKRVAISFSPHPMLLASPASGVDDLWLARDAVRRWRIGHASGRPVHVVLSSGRRSPVQELVAELGVDAFAVAVLRRRAGFDVHRLCACACQPLTQVPGYELRTIAPHHHTNTQEGCWRVGSRERSDQDLNSLGPALPRGS